MKIAGVEAECDVVLSTCDDVVTHVPATVVQAHPRTNLITRYVRAEIPLSEASRAENNCRSDWVLQAIWDGSTGMNLALNFGRYTRDDQCIGNV